MVDGRLKKKKEMVMVLCVGSRSEGLNRRGMVEVGFRQGNSIFVLFPSQ